MDAPNAADLVEDSIRLVDEASLTDAVFQGDVAALYGFQAEYESRPTYFRIMDVLERRGYFVTVDLEEHPDWDRYREALEELDATSVSPVLRRPDEEWSEEENPVVAYAADGTLYVEKGGEFWKKLVDAEVLDGEQTEPPADRTLLEAVADVVEGARRQEDLDTLLRWYVALGFHLGFELEEGTDEEKLLERLQSDRAVERIREAVADIDDLELTLAHPERGLEVPPPALREAHPILSWWYDLL